MLQYLSVGENYLSFLPEVGFLSIKSQKMHYALIVFCHKIFVSTGDWVVGGPGVIVRERQPQLTRSAL